MKTAFDLSLSEARGVLEAPAFGYRSVDELADFDDRFARVLGCPRRHSNAL
ncbi:MAG: hypothetical protein JNK05_25575 [Myxococcales bacterium]|nr:hypothetical protein [Myxococcales bacterium]